MSAHYPSDRTDSDRDRGLLPSVNIERTQVTIDGVTLPGTWIEDRGVIVQPGEEGRQFNRVTLTLLTGDITVGDGAVNRVQVDVQPVGKGAK